jgi:hypothetical protein
MLPLSVIAYASGHLAHNKHLTITKYLLVHNERSRKRKACGKKALTKAYDVNIFHKTLWGKPRCGLIKSIQTLFLLHVEIT